MNASELASKMLEWEQARRALDVLEGEIKAAVLEIGKTQTVGNARASYSNGRKSYDYETAGAIAPPEIVAQHTKPVIDWRSVCKDAGIEDVPFKQSGPSVSLKLLA